MRRWVYELIYRAPIPIAWVYGDHRGLVDKVLSDNAVLPGRALDLGCGVGVASVHLAKKGFDVTGVDFSPAAIRRASRAARSSGVAVRFLERDITDLRDLAGPYDLLVDLGSLSDLSPAMRDAYVSSVTRLSKRGSSYLLLCLDRDLDEPEVRDRLGSDFHIEMVQSLAGRRMAPAMTVYWLERAKHSSNRLD